MVSAAKVENKIVVPAIAVIWIAAVVMLVLGYISHVDLGPMTIYLWIIAIAIPALVIWAAVSSY